MAFSIMLWMPSWGGMINGIMTLSGAWDKLRTDPGLRFSVTAVGFYGMATFEGPVMSIRDVNALSHYTDWAHRPRAFRRARAGSRSSRSARSITWCRCCGSAADCIRRGWRRGTTGSRRSASCFYITSMWVAGIMEGLMWRAYDQFGFLQYSFVEIGRRGASRST